MHDEERDKLIKDIATKVGELHYAWPGLQAKVNAHEQRLNEHERRIVHVEGQVFPPPPPPRRAASDTAKAPGPTRSSDPAPKSGHEIAAEYGLQRAESTGRFRVSGDVLESIAGRFVDLEKHIHDLEQQKLGADELVERMKRRALFVAAVGFPVIGALAWLLTKVFHL
jgi:hypothetical protein